MPSVSKSQQRLMGVAYAVKSGSMELKDVDSEYRDKVASLVDGMTKKDLKKYASTKHDKLPETVDETIQQTAITPNTIGGMGDVSLPSNGQLGSGDFPHTLIQVADIDDEEEAKKQKGTVKNLQAEELALTFKAFVNEKMDINDPVLIKSRVAKMRADDLKKLDALKKKEAKEREKQRKKDMRRWNQKKYDQWLEDVASNGGWEHAFDMAQNAEHEPGLIDWVKKENPYDDAIQRIQWDIEAFAESVVNEKKLDREDMMAWIGKYMDFVKTTEEFNGSQGGIWVSGENGDEFKGRVIYAYYSEDYKNRTFGVDNRWEKELNKRGWYSEWHDAGTSMIWPL